MRNPNARVSDPNSFATSAGESYHILYSPKLNSDGSISLVESDRIDISASINSYAPMCDMAYIINRLMSGDTSVLRPGGSYGDFTQMPKSYAEMLDLVHRSESEFVSLPEAIKAEFDFDVNKWFSSAGSPEWVEKMKVGDINAPEVVIPSPDAS